MNFLPKELENIIFAYKSDFEQVEQFKKITNQIQQIEYSINENSEFTSTSERIYNNEMNKTVQHHYDIGLMDNGYYIMNAIYTMTYINNNEPNCVLLEEVEGEIVIDHKFDF